MNIIITGAAGNLGQIVSQRLLEDGHTLAAIIGPQDDPNFYQHDQLHILEGDLTDISKTKQVVEKCLDSLKTIDAVVCLAGTWAPGTLLEAEKETIDKLININFFTAYNLTQHILPHFKAHKSGRFLYVGAKPVFDNEALISNFAYGLSKSLLVKLAQAINASEQANGISAAIMAPSTIDTPATRDAMPDADFSKWVPRERLADTIQFFLSEAGFMLKDPIFEVYNKA